MRKMAVLIEMILVGVFFLTVCVNSVQREMFVLAQELPIPSRYENGWNYTLQEMEEIFRKEYSGPKILKNIFEKKGDDWSCTIQGEEITVPQKFIDKTIRHIQNMFDKKLIKYLFRLDCFHGHFFVDQKIYRSVYGNLDFRETTKKLMTDNSLGILFHNFEHLKIDGEEARELYKKRNVICWYGDHKSLQILPLPIGKISAVFEPDGGRNIAPPSPRFAAHKNGAFSLIIGGGEGEIKFDISFDDNSYI